MLYEPGLTLPSRLRTLALTAELLEKLERTRRGASADQFQTVARQLTILLAKTEPDPYLDAVLDRFPATAELYENLRYEHAGLCRSPFDVSLHAEMAAMTALAKAAGGR